MATVHRTFVNRGKNEVKELKPNYVYAVEYQLPADTARTLGIRIDQVGLIVVNHYGAITHNYNMVSIGSWEKGSVQLEGKHVWYASEMEIQFATNHVAFENLCDRFNTLRQDIKMKNDRLMYYIEQPLHAFVENLIDVWCEFKQLFKNRYE